MLGDPRSLLHPCVLHVCRSAPIKAHNSTLEHRTELVRVRGPLLTTRPTRWERFPALSFFDPDRPSPTLPTSCLLPQVVRVVQRVTREATLSTAVRIGRRRPGRPLDHATTRSARQAATGDVRPIGARTQGYSTLLKSSSSHPRACRVLTGFSSLDVGPRPTHPGAGASSAAGDLAAQVAAFRGHEVARFRALSADDHFRTPGDSC